MICPIDGKTCPLKKDCPDASDYEAEKDRRIRVDERIRFLNLHRDMSLPDAGRQAINEIYHGAAEIP